MKRNKEVAQALRDKSISKVLGIAVITLAALFITSGLAQSFNGFASYQDYLNNYYAQNQQVQSRAATVVPVIRAIPNNNTTPYNGFASYQDYLNNFYAGQNVSNPNAYPCGFQNILSLLVYGNDNCPPNTTAPRSTNTGFTNTDPFNGYPSYQAYLDAFYAGTVSPRNLANTNNSSLNNYYAYNSYDEFIRANYGNNNTLPGRGGTLPPSNPTPSTSLSGFFEFSVGQTYQFSNGLNMTVETLTDNRCPLNVQCFWQGDIVATVRLAIGNDIRNVTVSMIEGREAPQVVVNNASIQFVGLGNGANTLNAFVSMN